MFARSFDLANESMVKWTFKHIGLLFAARAILPFPFGRIGDSTRDLTNWLLRKCTLEGRNFEKSVQYVHDFTHQIIAETRTKIHEPRFESRQDLLALFIKAERKAHQLGDDKAKFGTPPLTDEFLCHIILNFMLAGRDTSGITMTWGLWELTQNPHVQEELIEEIDRVLQGRKPEGDDFSPENMPILHGWLMETLRLYPPVPENIKECIRDVTFKGTVIPKGTRMIYHPYAMGRDPNRFPEPLKFDPHRWIPFTEVSFPAFAPTLSK
jgi:cytochrome P450